MLLDAQTEAAACQATIPMLPDAQTEAAACQATFSHVFDGGWAQPGCGGHCEPETQ
jgi:hypothetical protein